MMGLMRELFPICRSLTGPGVRQTLDLIEQSGVRLQRTSIPTGTACFDWEVPREWSVRDAYVCDPSGNKVIDFQQSNLHLVGYSVPVRARMRLADLQPHLHSLPEQPDAIPYRTSYYNEYWGFCLSHEQREKLADGEYEVVIDTTLEPGNLDYATARLAGTGSDIILLSTYICHPSLANNELSGPVLVATLMKLLASLPPMRHSIEAVFVPETIGTIAYLSQHYRELLQSLRAGYVVSCVGDDGPYTYVRSKRHNSLADKAAEHVFRFLPPGHKVHIKDFSPVGSDERQYCSPGLNLPVGSILRSRHGEYAQYHTSKDDLSFVCEAGLAGALRVYLRVLQALELNCRPVRTNPFCEPQLGKRGLYPSLGTEGLEHAVTRLIYLLSYADGEHDLIDIANLLPCPVWELSETLEKLVAADLIRLNGVAAVGPLVS